MEHLGAQSVARKMWHLGSKRHEKRPSLPAQGVRKGRQTDGAGVKAQAGKEEGAQLQADGQGFTGWSVWDAQLCRVG